MAMTQVRTTKQKLQVINRFFVCSFKIFYIIYNTLVLLKYNFITV